MSTRQSARKRVRRTNTQVVSDLMNYGPHAVLAQAFIMDACIKQADAMLASDPASGQKNDFISHDLWRATALEVKTVLEAHMGGA